MNAQQIQDDLRGDFRGELLSNRATLESYSTDASLFSLRPKLVAAPRDEADLTTLVKYCNENQLPMFARGGGTGRSGESLGEGVVLDFRRHFRSLLKISDTSIRAQVGATLEELQLALAPMGRRIAVNPRSWRTATLGGLVATNASGSNVARYGYIRGYVQSLHVVWDNGEADKLQVGDETVSSTTRTTEIRTQVTALLTYHREVIQLQRCLTPFHRAGYLLQDVTSTRGAVNLARLLVGTEGTLSLTTAVELQTIPVALATAGIILGFRSLADALRAGLLLRTLNEVCSAEAFDQRLIALARSRWPADVSSSTELAAVLVVQLEGESIASLKAVISGMLQKLRESYALVCLVGETVDDTACFEKLSGCLASTFDATAASGARPVPIIEDTAAPCEELVRYVSGLTELLRRAELPGVFRINTLTGQVDVRPVLNPQSEEERNKLWNLAEQVYSLAIAIGGTISSKHGIGLTRTPWMAQQVGPLLPVFRELKQIFDPKQLLNPGKISSADPTRQAWPLPLMTPPSTASLPLLMWKDISPQSEAERCNRCSDCRVTTVPTRMCPAYRHQLDEVASPRGQAALVRLLQSAERRDLLANDDLRGVVSHCVNCKMCHVECPSHVNIPKLVLEAKAQIHAEQGLGRDEWVLARLGSMTNRASWLTTTTNLLLQQRPARWLMEKLLGLSRKRMLPKITNRTFIRRAKANGWTKRDKSLSADVKIAYFVDTFTNFADPTIGEATVLVLRRLGFPVYVPIRQRGSGIAALSQGDLDSARHQAAYNIRIFSELVRNGYTVLCSDPSSAMTIREDYPHLFDDEETKLFAANTFELTDWLGQRMQQAVFVKPLPYLIGHHIPCHIKATGRLAMGPILLRQIPGLSVTTIDKSCSGMAGTFGLKANAFDASLQIGQPMLDELRLDTVQYGSTECGSCRMQMQQGSRKRTFHPIQYLALAMGLLPKLETRMTRPLGQLATD